KYSVRAHGLDGNAVPGSPVYREDCLYDLETDPYERTNLVSHPGYAEVRAQLSRLLIRDMVQAGEPAPEILPLY
ncbi:MAG: arylsulfatase, partial [Christensenellales bacterium]